ncbi:MAG: serine hydrolase domain-containing protein, partial [Deinococcota bacterium]
MNELNQKLQALVDKEGSKDDTYTVLLGVLSGDGQINFQGAAGGTSTDSPYFIASISKMFTATVIMQLVDEGKLNLNDPIQQYLAHLPLDGIHVYKGVDYSKELKIYQLVHQTSGLADYFDGGLVNDFKQNKDRTYSVEDVLDIIRPISPAAAPDSGKSHYSDTNYQLLSAIIETITEQSLADAFHTRIFERLEMANTYLYDCTTPPSVEPLPFYYKDTQLSLPLAISSERGAGGAVSTMDDTLHYLQAYFEGQLFDKTHFERMMQWNAMFFPMHYGYGLWRFKLPRWTNLFRETPEFIGHAGFHGAMAFYNTDSDVYIVGTLNQVDKPIRQFNFMPKVINVIQSAS